MEKIRNVIPTIAYLMGALTVRGLFDGLGRLMKTQLIKSASTSEFHVY